jgi:lipopolysaccharide transport system permease protein
LGEQTQDIDTTKWSEIITSKRHLFEINLHELWAYRDLIWIFVRRDIVSSYKQTVLGPLWLFLGPLFTTFIYMFVFNTIASISTDGIPAPLFYLAGITMWNYFQSCLGGTSSTFISNAAIFGKVYFPRLASPIALVLSNLFRFFIQLGLFLVCWIYYLSQDMIEPNIHILLLPLILALMGILALGIGIIVSSLTTKYRDLSFFISFGVSLLMYATPVIYPVSAIPDTYKLIILYNPISPMIEAFRYGFTGAGTLSWSGLGYSSVFTLITLGIGIVLFNRVEKNFADSV